MASLPLKKKQNSVTKNSVLACCSCKKSPREPFLMGCLHSVCRECINDIKVGDRLKCPLCGDVSTSPPRTENQSRGFCHPIRNRCFAVPNAPLERHLATQERVAKLRSGEEIGCTNKGCRSAQPAIVFCKACKEFYCAICQQGHQIFVHRLEGDHSEIALNKLYLMMDNELLDLLSPRPNPGTCSEHRGKPLEYYCEVCETLLCQVCYTEVDNPHRCRYLEQSVDPRRKSIQVAGKVMDYWKAQYQRGLEENDNVKVVAEQSNDYAQQEVIYAFKQLQDALDERKYALLEKITATNNLKMKEFTLKNDHYIASIDSLSEKQVAINVFGCQAGSHELLQGQPLIVKAEQRTTARCRSETIHPTISPRVTFDRQNEAALLSAIRRFGHVGDGACAENCSLKEQTQDILHNGIGPVVLSLSVMDSGQCPCNRGGEDVKAFLRPAQPVPGPAIRGKVEDHNDGSYKITFDATYPGECNLYLLVSNRHAHGSPILVKPQDVRALGKSKGFLKFPEELKWPFGILVAPDGFMFVSDNTLGRIYMFDANEIHIRTFGEKGEKAGQLLNPRSMEVSGMGELFVASNNGVDVFSVVDGSFVRRFGYRELNAPYAIKIHQKMQVIFITDTNNHCIRVYSMAGKFKRKIGSKGSSPGQFFYPTGLLILPNDLLCVSDNCNDRIQILTMHGNFVKQFGKGLLNKPNSLLRTKDGNILVADSAGHCIRAFDEEGNLIHTFGRLGEHPGEVTDPHGLAFNRYGKLFVTECERVQIF